MRQRWKTLRDRHVLITGASRGLGLALAHACAERGARLTLLARDESALRAACEDLRRRFGCDAELLVCDLRERAQVERTLVEQLARSRRIDVLINNAGIIEQGPANPKSIAEYERAMAVHFWAPLQIMRAVIPTMQAQGEGRIVNISSVEGSVALPFIAPYSASKFALTGLSNALRAELASEGIYVTTVAPGLMHSSHAKAHASTFLARAALLPGLGTRYEPAARRILAAAMAGRRWVELDLLSRLLIRANALAPETTGALMERVSAVLRRP